MSCAKNWPIASFSLMSKPSTDAEKPGRNVGWNTTPTETESAFSGRRFGFPVVVSRKVTVVRPVAGSVSVLVRDVPDAYNSLRLGARMSRERVARKRMSGIGCHVAPSFHVVT